MTACRHPLPSPYIRRRARAHARTLTHTQVHYVLDKAPAGWKGGAGYLTPDMLKKYLPSPAPGNMIYVCGPPPMYQAVCGPKKQGTPGMQGELSGFLADMGYKQEQVFKF